MAATSFNGVTATVGGSAVLITSIDFSGGDTALVDTTATTDAFRQNIAGIRAPFTVTLSGHSETGALPDAGATVAIVIANGPLAGTYSGIATASSVTGSIDAAVEFSLTVTEAAGTAWTPAG
tara:strand:- start:2200 stop:2565 length:366 start_codon:yes stop_codon:yes gene_type:complete